MNETYSYQFIFSEDTQIRVIDGKGNQQPGYSERHDDWEWCLSQVKVSQMMDARE